MARISRPRLRGAAVRAVVVLLASGCAVAGGLEHSHPPVSSRPSSPPSPGVAAEPGVTVPASNPFVRADGTGLTLDGQPYRPVGLDIYELATDWGQNLGCGGMFDDADLDQLFSSLPPGTLVRIWAWQGSMATSPSGQRDWGPLDRIVATAARHGIELVMSLGSQHGNCDDGVWKDASWYAGGYRSTVGPGDGYAKVTTSYWSYVSDIVTRYRDDPAIAMWEPINEPEASSCAPGYAFAGCYGHLSCPDEATGASALRSFFDTVGGLIHSLDPNHLVESGAIGGPQCGWVGSDTDLIDASPGIDVTSYHQDTGSAIGLPDFQVQLDASRALGKPLLVGELGVTGGTGAVCTPTAYRAASDAATIAAMTTSGASGVLLWNYEQRPAACGLGIGPGDEALTLLTGR